MNIEYVEEKELEEVFSGTLVLDGIPMTEEEQRKRIIEMMHLAGVEVDNEDNLVIQYEGADDDFGISETQSTKFSVMNEVIKKVPYKVTREEVFEGTFVLDGIPMTEEEQRERIFNMMTLAGVEVGNKDELEIGYEGAEDDFGISETESTRFIVTRVKRERLEDDTKEILEDDTKEILEDDTKEIVDDDLKINNDIDDKLLDELNKSLNDIKDIREKLDNIKDSTNRNDLILEALEKTKNLEDKLKEKGLLATEFEEELESLNIEISRLEKEIKEETKKYEESYKKLTKLITEQNEKLSNGELLTEEEYNKIKEEYLRLIEEENNVSVIIKNNIELRKKEISNLKRKRNKIQKDINTAKALGLSTSEYIELTSTLRKKRIMDAILKEKGLSEIISKKASERTKEETELLKATKEQIIKEIAEIQKEKNISALEAIEIFYNIDTKVLLVKKSRKDTLTSTEIENIKNKVNKTPNKVHKKDKQEINYTPDPAPIDIPIEEKKEEKEEAKEELEVIRLIKEDEKFYVNKKTLFRFVLDSVGKELEIDGEKFYRIDREDAEYIIGNANNKYSPYKAEVTELEIEKEEEEKVDIDYTNEDVTEVIALLRDVKDDNKIYVRKNTMLRFTLDAIGEEIEIDGAVYYPIAEEDAKYIIGNANNNYSPYTVEIRDFDKNKSEDDEDEIEDDIEYTDEDVREVIKLFRDVDNENKMYVREPVVKRFNLTVDEFDAVEIDDTKCFPIDEDDAKYIIGNADNGYSPYTVEIEDVHLGKKLDPTTDEEELDEIEIFIDLDNDNKKYVKEPVVTRFRLVPIGDSADYEGEDIYPIDEDDAEYIIDNQDNGYSPYKIVTREIHLGKKHDEVDIVTIYVDLDNENKKYVNDSVISKFGLVPIGESLEIEGESCSPISEEDVQLLYDNQDNKEFPYKVEEKEVHLGKKHEDPIKEDKELIIYRDISDDNQLYISKEDAYDLLLFSLDKTVTINGIECIKIDSTEEDYIKDFTKDSDRYNYIIKYVDVDLKKKHGIDDEEEDEEEYTPHVEEILDKITKDLDIRSKDVKRYQAGNIKIAKTFAEELHSGNYAYNIVHLIPATLKAGINFFRKLGGKLTTTLRAKNTVEAIMERLDNLDEKELEVLFNEYKGSQLKTDMNNQINPLILDAMRKFGLKKVEDLNNRIKNNYSNLFVLLGEIKAIEEKLEKAKDEEKLSLAAEKSVLYSKASKHVREILDDRKKANDLLSSGIHGLEEDYKAVASKMNYVGLRFTKTHDFDNELQQRLGELGHDLNIGLAKNDSQKIVDSFMALESAYFDNTKISGSLLGRRSTGSKYYTPLAEQFNYNDDPFIRDLFTTIAITTSAISAVNAIKTHKMTEVQQDTTANDQMLDNVHRAGQEISARGETFRRGMAQQAEQDIINTANTRERLQLDMTGWKFTDEYHAADAAGHQMYNAFNDNVQSQINGISSQYAQGLITQSEALRQMTSVSSYAQQQLLDVVNSGLSVIRKYAAEHPQFDLHAYEEAMSAVLQNPNAIVDMNNAMTDVVAIGEYLQSLSLPQQQLLATLPSDLTTTLANAAAAVCLATNVSSTMNRKYGRKNVYGNEIIDMMDKYKEEEKEEEETKHR